MYASLAQFVAALDQAGELRRIDARVSPILEISAIADRVSKSHCANLPSVAVQRTDPRFHKFGGHALVFSNVESADFPVLINAWGSYRRMEMALGCTRGGFEEVASRLADLVKPEPPRSLREMLGAVRKFAPLLRTPPRRQRGSGQSQQVVLKGQDVDLRRLPLLRCWPHDGDPTGVGYPPGLNNAIPGAGQGVEWEQKFRGRYITLGGIHTIHADDRDDPAPRSHNIGMYRVQLLGPRLMAMHWHMHHDGAAHWRSWKALGKPMPVAIALGGSSVMPYAATAPMPPGMSELLLAGFLQGKGVPLVRAKTVPLWVPADAEMVIEGYCSNRAGLIGWDPRGSGEPLGDGAAFEGPFGDHTGFYSLPDRYPVLEVTAFTHRREAIYPTTIVGLPPQEDYYLGKATERIFLPLLRTILPDIIDYDLPMFGAFHNCAFIKVRKHYPMQARRVMHGVWGAGQMSWTKSIFVVDEEVDVHDSNAVLAAAARHCEPSRDVERAWGPLDILDHAAPRLGAGMKLGYDCTRRVPGEEGACPELSLGSATPSLNAGDSADLSAILAIAGVRAAALHALAWVFVSATDTGEELPRKVLERSPVAARFVILVGPDVDPANPDQALFHWCANFDASRDLSERPGTMIFDARPKRAGTSGVGQPIRDWPPLLVMDTATRERVTARWTEFGL